MRKIYQLMVGDRQINAVYPNEGLAVYHAELMSEDREEIVRIWEAEETPGLYLEDLEWELIKVALNGVVYAKTP